jgi:hypothetical protein
MQAAAESAARRRTVFTVERGVRGKRQSYRYLCGSCGTPLIHHATRELLDCVFYCRTCRTLNEAPLEVPDTEAAPT